MTETALQEVRRETFPFIPIITLPSKKGPATLKAEIQKAFLSELEIPIVPLTPVHAFIGL